MASANCPEKLPVGILAKQLVQNYDGTCTVIDPHLNDRGYQKRLTGETDEACKLFGFGAKAGVDQERHHFVGSPEKVMRTSRIESKTISAQSLFSSITCRGTAHSPIGGSQIWE